MKLKKIQKYADKNGIKLPIIIFKNGTDYYAEDFIYVTSNLEILKNLINMYSKK